MPRREQAPALRCGRHHWHGINPIISAEVSAVRPCEFHRVPMPCQGVYRGRETRLIRRAVMVLAPITDPSIYSEVVTFAVYIN